MFACVVAEVRGVVWEKADVVSDILLIISMNWLHSLQKFWFLLSASLRVSTIANLSLESILVQKSSCSFKTRLLIFSKTSFISGGPSSAGGCLVLFSRMMLLMLARSLPVWRSILGRLSPTDVQINLEVKSNL